jgi:hypothetical protein
MWRRVELVWTDVSEEDRGDTFLHNVGSHKIYTAPQSQKTGILIHKKRSTIQAIYLLYNVFLFTGHDSYSQ